MNSASENDGTTALHVCASSQPSNSGNEDFLSTASVVMGHGGNPYQENAVGMSRKKLSNQFEAFKKFNSSGVPNQTSLSPFLAEEIFV